MTAQQRKWQKLPEFAEKQMPTYFTTPIPKRAQRNTYINWLAADLLSSIPRGPLLYNICSRVLDQTDYVTTEAFIYITQQSIVVNHGAVTYRKSEGIEMTVA